MITNVHRGCPCDINLVILRANGKVKVLHGLAILLKEHCRLVA